MRRPSDRHSAYQVRDSWPPEPGLFKMRLCKNGWQVPAQIEKHGDGTFTATVDEGPGDVADVWHYGMRIGAVEYLQLLACKREAELEDPDHPCLNPRKPIDPLTVKPVKPRSR